jgi:hypothetical protein
MTSTVSPGAIRVVGFLYVISAVLSIPGIFVVWSLAVPVVLREPSSKAIAYLAIFAAVLTSILAAGVAGLGLLRLRPWARIVALGLNGLVAASILFEVFSKPPVMLGELVLPGAILLMSGRGLGVAAVRQLRRLASRRLSSGSAARFSLPC